VTAEGPRYTVPGRLAPTRSPLARVVRALAADARQGEALYFVALVVLGAVALLAGQVAWFALPASAWPGLLAAGGGLAAFALGGWLPALHVRVSGGTLHVRRGPEAVTLPPAEAQALRRVSAREAHAHWRRYGATRHLANRMDHDLLLVCDAEGTPWLIGLPDEALAELEAIGAPDEPAGTPVPLAA
jgi:hypothetical protein